MRATPEISTKELASLLGVTERTVRALAEKGVLPRGSKAGLWPMIEAVRSYVAHLRKRGALGKELADARTRERIAKARLAEIEVEEREGNLLPLALVQATCGSIIIAFTNRLANFGDGLASICHNQSGEFVAQRVNEGLRSALRELSKLPYVPIEGATPTEKDRQTGPD